MSSILIFLMRLLMAVTLYSFLAYVLYSIWRELHLTSQLLSSRQVPALILRRLDDPGDHEHSFSIPEVVVGRDPACEMPVADSTVSVHHARFSYHHNQWWIEDLRSTNGTMLNDERVSTATVVISGDQVRCGKVDLTLHIKTK
jgi:hypothetical protein